MMDVTIPVIHRTGIKNPVVAIIVKIACFMMTPSFPAYAAGLAMAHRRFPSLPPACHRISPPLCLYIIH